ncbi:MAG: DNA alkylation repair protein [Candidatus Izemoplasmatales bacterium]|nr:DNA alkylation repair protein [Candidatus Izemoplasmatales bacterium]
MLILEELKADQRVNNANPLSKFHKTGVGEYQHGDVFWDIPIPKIRRVVKNHYQDVSYDDIDILLASNVHEVRLCGLLILTELMKTISDSQKPRLVNYYLEHLDQINGWDLVDLSAPAILGTYIYEVKDSGILDVLAKSDNLWHRRIAIVATLKLIKHNELNPTYRIVKKLINDQEDLIHKACGWMLREAGKQNRPRLDHFLRDNYSQLSRTTLRYAIEKHDESERKAFLKGNF